MKDIQLTLTIEELNRILSALGQLPYVQIYDLINKIQAQVSVQVSENGIPEKTIQQK